ncbi:restriction endonuclease subunit S [Micromonospora sp. CPCC 206060]|uniref:restriction endonuclease subunit S n=1 Tax=Micromonospora sp. CPCC 206060 TaxID=3122406 RepID=UPI002FEFEF50
MSDPMSDDHAAGFQEGWVRAPLARFLSLNLESVDVDPGQMYPTVGVLNRGRGLLYRDPVAGSSTSYKQLNRIGPGVLVYSRLKAFEGAVTVTPDDLPESFASQEFPTFTFASDADPSFFRILTTTQGMWDALQGASKGMGGRRERVKPADFLSIVVDIPPLPTQKRIVEIVEAVDDQITTLDVEANALTRVHHATRESLLQDAPLIPLSDVCELTARLVDPRLKEYADLIHIGVEAIAKDTGEIIGARTAREDGLISGKYLFGEGDVIYSKIRPSLRKVAVPGFSGLCSADAYPLTPKDGVPATLLREVLLQERVVESSVSMAGRTKMPKVNRKQLFSILVALPRPESLAVVDAALSALRKQREAVLAEAACLRKVRAGLLSGLLDRTIDIKSAELKV